jgi:hypothetical protein
VGDIDDARGGSHAYSNLLIEFVPSELWEELTKRRERYRLG